MAYAEDAVKAKLSALNETHESIVNVAQWVMFHRRHADRTAQIWLTRLKDSSSNKRLNLIYLANEVAQQSKARRKDDFLHAFAPIIAEAVAVAYRGATSEIQTKLRRVVEVWRQRQIFDSAIQDVVEAKMEEMEKSRSSSKRPALGGSLFSSSSSSAPPELQEVVKLQLTLSKANATLASAAPTAESEFTKLTDPEKPNPSAPVYAARLSALLKSLSAAESAVADSIKARKALLSGLEKLVAESKEKLTSEESQHATLTERKTSIENKKRDVEDSIMRGLSNENSPVTPADPRTNGRSSTTPAIPDPDRPDVEALTPPSVPEEDLDPAAIANGGVGEEAEYEPSSQQDNPALPFGQPIQPTPQIGADLLSSLNVPGIGSVGQYGAPMPSAGGGMAKKRKLDDEGAAVFGGADAMADLDEDVAELLRQESGGR